MIIKKTTLIICTVILSLGLIGGGASIGKGIYRARMADRTVTLKGLAEKDVVSDLGLWDVNYREIGNDLVVLDQKIQKAHQSVTAFLKERGFTDQEISRTQIRIEDRFANVYNQNNPQSTNEYRYVVTAGTRVRSEKVDLIAKSVREVELLIQQGIMLTFDASLLSPNPSFYYTKLDSIRPEMMSLATKSAFIVAKQFANDSSSQLAGIQRANQGVFQVMSRDTSTMSADWNNDQNALGSILKKVRLVTTVVYQIK
jgi:hypothetical protein